MADHLPPSQKSPSAEPGAALRGEPRAALLALVELGLVLWTGFRFATHTVDPTALMARFFGYEVWIPSYRRPMPLQSVALGLITLVVLTYLALLVFELLSGRSEGGRGGGRPGGRAAWGRRLPLSVFCWVLIGFGAVLPAAQDMLVRADVDEVAGNQRAFRSRTHDGGVLQTELAMTALMEGRNPYRVDYGETVMARAADSQAERWRGIGYERNPALGHIPYLPAMFLLPIPVRAASEALFDWYDQRLFYLLAALVLVLVSGRLVGGGRPRRIVWLLVGVSPFLLPFLRIGRNDVVLLALLALMALALKRGRTVWAAGLLGLACASKQFAWFVVPFFLIWLWRDERVDGRSAGRALTALVAVGGLVCLPFLLWGPEAFLEDVLFFNLGLTADAYPLRPDSSGVAAIALGLGWATGLRDGFPLWAFQLLVTLPLAALGAVGVWRKPSAARVFLASALALWAALFCSAFFALNYWSHPAFMVLAAALLGLGEVGMSRSAPRPVVDC